MSGVFGLESAAGAANGAAGADAVARGAAAEIDGSMRVVTTVQARIDLGDLRNRPHVMLAAAELGLHPLPHDGDGAVGIDPATDAEQIHVQALAALTRRLGILARGRPDTGEPVARHRAAGPALAQQDAELHEPFADGGGDGFGHRRVVHGSRAVRPEIEHRVVVAFERFDDGRLQGKSDVVASDGDTHVISPRTS